VGVGGGGQEDPSRFWEVSKSQLKKATQQVEKMSNTKGIQGLK